jgi:4-hydroxy-tetrahydrodipicolinate reductase
MTRIAIIGVTGRMGQALVRAAGDVPEVSLAGGVASASSSAVGRDIGELAGISALGLAATNDLASVLAQSDVAVDFSRSEATAANLAACRAARKPLLIGTTGFDAELSGELEKAARDIAVLVAPNTSLAVTLLIELVRASAKSLPRDFDIEIVETHHRMKRDAPSGTALALGRAAAEGRGTDIAKAAVLHRSGGVHERKEGDIGFAVVRGGDIAGEHTVLFAGDGEQLVLQHRAADRAIFARGALRAAVWLSARPPGRFFMRDVLGYKSIT